ncbi:hypothetical protein [Pseudodonghicola flavimaris]|uniref:Dihydroorotate dehydrogenase n=1 Tax=Pseudodonghicola flavimaris TaxID=3050036 RepID=A0ABT7EUZ5_9RHOB|nr:hypothetical protein [Pseudodonghicola flavimaris]MDK3016156.1 hypothetical protein [Pseudodonghicola flavimaris]
MTDRQPPAPLPPVASPPGDDTEFDLWLRQSLSAAPEARADPDALSRAVLTRLVTPAAASHRPRLSPGGVLAGYGTLLSLGVLAGYMALPMLGISSELVVLIGTVTDGLGLMGGLR